MYRVITYRSKPLKKNTIIIEEDFSSSDFDEPKKKRKRDIDEKTYLIDGVEVREEDLTPDEKLDIESNALVNGDGFYTPLQPIDAYFTTEETQENKKSNNALKIGLVIGAAVILLAGMIALMIKFL